MFATIMNLKEVEFFICVLCSILFAFIIGIERELSGHRGSIKVNVLIALGSCIFTYYESLIDVSGTRMAANIITGVGFLCSGFIFKNGLTINGLGTAATLWCSSGIGILVSRGYILESFILSVLIFILNIILPKITRRLKSNPAFDDTNEDLIYSFNIVCLADSVKKVKKAILSNIDATSNISLESFAVNTITTDKSRIICHCKLDKSNIFEMDKILTEIQKISGVFSSSWEKIND